MVKRIAWMAALGAAGVALAGCSDRAGYGGGLGYAGYYGGGYDGDYGPAGYDQPYGYGYADDYGYGFGWYDGFYYPGAGLYVYDRYRRPYRWTDGQRRYWQSRPGRGNPQGGGNWQGFGGAHQGYWSRQQNQAAGVPTPHDHQSFGGGGFRGGGGYHGGGGHGHR